MLSSVVRIVFSLLLIVGVPLLSWRSARPEQVQGIPKTALYFSAVVSQWILAVIGALVVFFAWPDWLTVGLAPVSGSAFFDWTVVLVVASVAGLGLVLAAMPTALPIRIAIVAAELLGLLAAGWWMLLGIVPFLGWIVLVYFACVKGTAGAHRFGPEPVVA